LLYFPAAFLGLFLGLSNNHTEFLMTVHDHPNQYIERFNVRFSVFSRVDRNAVQSAVLRHLRPLNTFLYIVILGYRVHL
jgi:hypothetical protein